MIKTKITSATSVGIGAQNYENWRNSGGWLFPKVIKVDKGHQVKDFWGWGLKVIPFFNKTEHAVHSYAAGKGWIYFNSSNAKQY